MSGDGEGEDPRLAHPTAVGPDRFALRTLVSDESGDDTRVADVHLPDLDARPASRASGPPPLPAGLVWEGLLGRGAIGEVHRVRDVALNRAVALKILQPRLSDNTAAVQRFLDEAQATAQLQHPGIVPVHSLGTLPDGRVFFTMLEVRGRTLGDVIEEVYEASTPAAWRTGASGTSFRRLVDHFYSACRAVAYAHERGVVHRDLKPDNVMIGAHGQVLVMDWGLAKVVGRRSLGLDPGDGTVTTSRTDETRAGVVFGTPAYMPPEQARGAIDALDSRTDVYALGAILFSMLYGRRPYHGLTSRVLIGRIANAIPPELPDRPGPPVPQALEAIRARAMAMDPDERQPDASALADEVVAWLDGSARREKALVLVRQAWRTVPEARSLRESAADLRLTASRRLERVPGHAPESTKVEAWEDLARADALDARADLLDVEADQLLQGALGHDPDLVEAREALAERTRRAHEQAELARDAAASRRAEAQLRPHVRALPPGDARSRHEAWLAGSARLTLRTEPAVPVRLERYEVRSRRLVAVPVRPLGTTPLVDTELPHGSYRLVLDAPGGEVRLPVRLARDDHGRFVRPDGTRAPLHLPEPGDLGPDDIFVPEGWAWLGGDPNAIGSAPRERAWVDSFVIRRFPVTNAEYVAFLDDLVATGREAEALRHVPREKGGTVGEVGAMIYGRGEAGRFVLRPDADGDMWGPDQPVASVDWHGATAYAAWEAARTGRPWRLPRSREWEKAGRGVDGRFYPWGDWLDPSWCCMRDSHAGRPLFTAMDTYPVDESPYGVRHLAGNVRDWCLDEVADGRKIDRGGFWLGSARESRLADSHQHVTEHRASEIGFRLARSG